jgi:hypothetical protein
MDHGFKMVVGRGAIPTGWTLDISLTNESAERLTVYRHSLPWIGWYSILLVAAKTDAMGTVLERSNPVDDPGTETIVIKPGETLTGQVSLVRRFPGFADAVKDREVIVFWSYQLQRLEGDPWPRTGGYVLFPEAPLEGRRLRSSGVGSA